MRSTHPTSRRVFSFSWVRRYEGREPPLSEIELLVDRITADVLTVSLVFEDPKIKPVVCRDLLERFLSRDQVLYIDFDLQLSSLLQNLDKVDLERFANSGRETFLQPNNDINSFIEAITSLKIQAGGVVVLDSLNSLQTILTDESSNRSSKTANQRTALVVTLLQIFARFFSRSLIITNVARSRPRDGIGHATQWEKRLIGGRMIKFKSDLILVARQSDQDFTEIDFTVQNARNESSGEFLVERYRIWV